MIRIFDDLETLSQGAAQLFAEQAVEAVADRGIFRTALSGGSTPRRTYEILALEPLRGRVPWTGVHIFWGDERCVPPDHPESNARMAREALLDLVPVPSENVHPVAGDKEPQEAARMYESELREHFSGAVPRFDLIFLGLGSDGHTASLFPCSPTLQERKRWVIETHKQTGGGLPRVTLTLPVLNLARVVCFLVAGGNKAKALAEVTRGSTRPHPLPAQRVMPGRGELLWFVDREAAIACDKSALAGSDTKWEKKKDALP
jgi:6-phosphogluconolactonase